jgi:hypothetical protein
MHEAQRLFKLAVVGLATACRTMQLVDARNGSPRPATDVIDAALLSAAEAIGATLEGKTERQKTPIRRILWPGWPGPLPDLVAGIATINHLAPRPCGPDGDNSKAWPRVLLSPRPLNLSQISESRRLTGVGGLVGGAGKTEGQPHASRGRHDFQVANLATCLSPMSCFDAASYVAFRRSSRISRSEAAGLACRSAVKRSAEVEWPPWPLWMPKSPPARRSHSGMWQVSIYRLSVGQIVPKPRGRRAAQAVAREDAFIEARRRVDALLAGRAV